MQERRLGAHTVLRGGRGCKGGGLDGDLREFMRVNSKSQEEGSRWHN